MRWTSDHECLTLEKGWFIKKNCFQSNYDLYIFLKEVYKGNISFFHVLNYDR